MKQLKRFRKPIIAVTVFVIIWIIIANVVISKKSKGFIYEDVTNAPRCYVAIVLGAKVSSSGTPSDYLQDRLDMAIKLYRNKKIKRFLLSGDHGQTNYDEVNSMKSYLIKQGIPTTEIFLDHAGFDTYSTMVRAKKVFQVNDAIIVTQEFHLPRAVYLARSKGIQAYGVIADKRIYIALKTLKIREVLARVKAFTEVSINKRPKYLGDKIPITGDSKLSYD
jgi:SanA protein